MLTFDMMLKAAGVEPSRVHLVRHQKSKPLARGTPYILWRDHRADFELYQSLQGSKCFEAADYVASFVVPPSGETLFVGMYTIGDVSTAPPQTIDPLSLEPADHCFLYDLSASDVLSDYIERLVIKWGGGYIAWHQRGGKDSKSVSELRLRRHDEPFPGYVKFVARLSTIELLPPLWKERLREVKGVYVLTSEATREHYVGSASGRGGFFERWCQHARAGGDAMAFRGLAPSEYQVSILQVSDGFETDDDIVRSEHVWMDKLQSRSMGMNGNPTSVSQAPIAETPVSPPLAPEAS